MWRLHQPPTADDKGVGWQLAAGGWRLATGDWRRWVVAVGMDGGGRNEGIKKMKRKENKKMKKRVLLISINFSTNSTVMYNKILDKHQKI